jgi:hypothetical protein
MSKNLEFYNDFSLTCPACGEPNMHQRKVSIFWRTEDAEEGNHVVSQFGHTLTDISMHGNPSPRRDGIVIDFECETCDAEPRLSIVQHKGATVMAWDSARKSF